MTPVADRLAALLKDAWPTPWAMEAVDPDRARIVCHAYSDETPVVCGPVKGWPGDANTYRLIVALVNAAPEIIAVLRPHSAEGFSWTRCRECDRSSDSKLGPHTDRCTIGALAARLGPLLEDQT